MRTINLTPTWGEFGNIYARLAESGETKSVQHLRADLARAMAAAQALQELQSLELTPAQSDLIAKVITVELRKQGYGGQSDGIASYQVCDPFSECVYSYPVMRRALERLDDLKGSIITGIRKDGSIACVFRRQADGWLRDGAPFDMVKHLAGEAALPG